MTKQLFQWSLQIDVLSSTTFTLSGGKILSFPDHQESAVIEASLSHKSDINVICKTSFDFARSVPTHSTSFCQQKTDVSLYVKITAIFTHQSSQLPTQTSKGSEGHLYVFHRQQADHTTLPSYVNFLRLPI